MDAQRGSALGRAPQHRLTAPVQNVWHLCMQKAHPQCQQHAHKMPCRRSASSCAHEEHHRGQQIQQVNTNVCSSCATSQAPVQMHQTGFLCMMHSIKSTHQSLSGPGMRASQAPYQCSPPHRHQHRLHHCARQLNALKHSNHFRSMRCCKHHAPDATARRSKMVIETSRDQASTHLGPCGAGGCQAAAPAQAGTPPAELLPCRQRRRSDHCATQQAPGPQRR